MDIFGNSEDGSGITSPATSTTNALVRYADTTGKLLKNSTVTLSDAGDLTGLKGITPPTGWPVQLYGDLDMGQNLIIDLATPVNDFDAVTKLYVDGKAGNQTATPAYTTFTGTVEANILKKTGGTNIQYLMADGSVLSQSANAGNSNFYLYKSHTNTPTPPPTAGFVYYNNAIQKNATIIYISHLTEDNIDIEIFFQNLSSLNEIYLQQKILSDNFIKYNITGIPTIITGSHISIPVAVISFGGTGEISFGANEPILVSFFTNNLEVDTRLSNLETKTQNQSAISATTTISGTVITSVVQLNNITTSGVQISVDANLDMGQNSIHDLGTPANDYDAANKLYVDEKAGNQSATTGLTTFTGGISILGVVDMNGYALANVATPLISTDGANKSYVDSAKSFIDLTPTTTPTAVKGRIYYDNASNYLKYYNGYEWRTIDPWIQPAMTSNTTPVGYVVSSNNAASAAWLAYDGVLIGLNGCFISFDSLFIGTDGLYAGASTGKTGIANQGVWVVLELPYPQLIGGYTLYSRQGSTVGNPKAWHIMYSLNGTNYVSVDNKTNYIFTASESITVTFSPITAKYWGIQVYKANYSQMIFQELKFFP